MTRSSMALSGLLCLDSGALAQPQEPKQPPVKPRPRVAEAGIRIGTLPPGTGNAISPTWVETDFGKNWMKGIGDREEGTTGEQYIADAKAANPQNRLIQPQEIGALAAFLCRDEAFGITMQDLTVSAGSLW